MRNRRLPLVLVLGLLVVPLGCTKGAADPEPTAAEEVVPEGGVVFEDDFESGETEEWEEGDETAEPDATPPAVDG